MPVLDFALNAPDATVAAAYRGDEYTTGDWPDRTGNGYDLAEATNPPAAIADGGSGFNNQPVVRGNSSNDFLSEATFSLSAPYTIIVIGEVTTDDVGLQVFVGDNAGAAPYIGVSSAEALILYTGGSQITGSADLLNVPVLIEATYSASGPSARVNHEFELSGGATTVEAMSGLRLFARGTGSFLGGDIAEVIIVDGTLTHADRVYLAQYVNQRYGFALPFPQTEAPTETAFASATTSHAVSIPAVEAGEALRVHMIFNTAASSIVLSPPDGTWLEIENNPSGGIAYGAYAKAFSAGQAATTVNFSTNNSSTGVAVVHKISLWGGAVDTDIERNSAGASTTNPNPPSLTGPWGALNNLWFALVQYNDDDETVTAYPSGFTGGSYVVSGAGTNAGAGIGSAWLESAAATVDPGPFTLSGTEGTGSDTEVWRPLRAVSEVDVIATLHAIEEGNVGLVRAMHVIEKGFVA